MSRYTGPKCKLCRREGTKLFLKGARCLSIKCGLTRRQQPPGVHGAAYRRRPSDYSKQLREKQKVKRIYGVSEAMFRRYYKNAKQTRKNTGEELLSLLERRVDSVLYRIGVALSRSHARQLCRFGRITVSSHKVISPSFLLSDGDTLELDNSLNIPEKQELPAWLKLEKSGCVKVDRLPSREDITEPIEEQLIVEFYSR